eukprot:1774775-Lingulodinium_polyedra.AAC.1
MAGGGGTLNAVLAEQARAAPAAPTQIPTTPLARLSIVAPQRRQARPAPATSITRAVSSNRSTVCSM